VKAIQVLIRDLFGGVVFNQIFPNLPVAVSSISLFLHMWDSPISQVLLLTEKVGGKLEKRVFKVFRDESGLFLRSHNGEEIILPEPVEEGDEDIDEDGDLFGLI